MKVTRLSVVLPHLPAAMDGFRIVQISDLHLEPFTKPKHIQATINACEPPTTRLSPDRCIVQLGPVALTVAHIRTGNDVPPGGQLLCIIWEGTIAARGDHVPERSARHVPPPPVSVWEESMVVSAASETTWHWHPNGIDSTGYTSPELAERIVEQLQAAFDVAQRDDLPTAPLS